MLYWGKFSSPLVRKVLEFLLENFQDLESPGKWHWSRKVLAIYLQGPSKSCNLLDSDVHGSFWFQTDIRHVYADENSHDCCHQVRFLRCRYAKMLSRPGFLPGPRWQNLQRSPRLLSCCLLLYLNLAGLRRGPGKMLLGAWKVLEFFVTNREGTLSSVRAQIAVPHNVGYRIHTLPHCSLLCCFVM